MLVSCNQDKIIPIIQYRFLMNSTYSSTNFYSYLLRMKKTNMGSYQLKIDGQLKIQHSSIRLSIENSTFQYKIDN